MLEFEFETDIDYEKLANAAGQAEIFVGYIEGTPHESGEDMVELVKKLTFGDAKIPERPFIHQGILEGSVNINKRIEAYYRAKIEGNSGELELNAIGVAAVGEIKQFVMGDYYKSTVPNSQKTINLKGSDTPLVDTGQTINALNYVASQERGHLQPPVGGK